MLSLSKTFHMHHARIQKVLSEWVQVNFDEVCQVDGKKDPPKANHHRLNRETPLAFRWRADNGPTLNAGMVAL